MNDTKPSKTANACVEIKPITVTVTIGPVSVPVQAHDDDHHHPEPQPHHPVNGTHAVTGTHAVNATKYRLMRASLMGLYYGPKFVPAPGCLPFERSKNLAAWAEITGVLDKCIKDWMFEGTHEAAKIQAPAFISEQLQTLNPELSVQSMAGYKTILDPITDEVIGHDYSGWVYNGEEPLEAALTAGTSGVYAALFVSIRKA